VTGSRQLFLHQLHQPIYRSLSSFTNKNLTKHTFEPISPNDLHRAGGIASFMRLPIAQPPKANGDLDVAFLGIPLDTATSNRPGARFGPRHIRTESPMVRKRNHATGAQPFDTLKVADIGDVDVCLYDIKKAADRITDYYNGLMSVNCKPLTMGGDHFVSYPILRAIAAKHGPVALIHVDAHADTAEHQSHFDLTHGTPFRRAWEDKLLDNEKVFQIGIRGTGYEKGDTQWGRDQGWRVVRAEECWHKSLDPLMSEIRNTIGQDTPVYLSFDIDSIDPSACPGTGTPEIGGLTTAQALEVVRGCKGLNLVGCDLVEVAPIYDVTGTTAITAANLLYEMLCVMPGVQYIQPDV